MSAFPDQQRQHSKSLCLSWSRVHGELELAGLLPVGFALSRRTAVGHRVVADKFVCSLALNMAQLEG